MTRPIFLILLPCLLLSGCVGGVPRVVIETHSEGSAKQHPVTTHAGDDQPIEAARARESAGASEVDHQTQQLLDKLSRQDGVDGGVVAQLRKDFAAATPESRPFLLKSLLALTVGAREVTREQKPAAGADEATRVGDGGQTGRREESWQTEKVAIAHELAASNPAVSPASFSSPSAGSVSNDGFVQTMFGSNVGGSCADRDAWRLFSASTSVSDDTDNEGPARNWQDCVHEAIEAVENELARPSDGDTDTSHLEARLRMLHLIANDRVEAARPIAALKPHEQEFWAHQLHGLALLLDREQIPSSHRRAAAALAQLQVAAENLSEGCGLRLKNFAFCTEVVSYGVYHDFARDVFRPDQEVQLYVEVENFMAQPTSQGYETAFCGSYRILDTAGQPIFDHTYQAGSETCRNRRRDLFIRYRMWIPKRINPGRYTLEIEIEDIKGKKFGQAAREFTIAG